MPRYFRAPQWPVFTVTLIALSVVMTLMTGFGRSLDTLQFLLISDYNGYGLPEVMSGQLWRLITPIFIHFGVLHILFNMLWLWDLGGAVEYRQGSANLGLLVLVIGVAGNLAQYYFSGPMFGGMSGVVYGLLGYVWMQGRYNPRAGLFLHQQIVVMMLVWYAVCWTGLVGSVANMAHTMGLVVGVAWGYLAAQMRPRPRRS